MAVASQSTVEFLVKWCLVRARTKLAILPHARNMGCWESTEVCPGSAACKTKTLPSALLLWPTFILFLNEAPLLIVIHR